MKNIEEEITTHTTQYISDKLLKLASDFIDSCSGLKLCGSVSLVLNGDLGRVVSDLDFVCEFTDDNDLTDKINNIKNYFKIGNKENITHYVSGADYIEDENCETFIKGKKDNIEFDIWFFKKEFKSEIYNYKDLTLPVTDSKYALDAKRKYVEKYDKIFFKSGLRIKENFDKKINGDLFLYKDIDKYTKHLNDLLKIHSDRKLKEEIILDFPF